MLLNIKNDNARKGVGDVIRRINEEKLVFPSSSNFPPSGSSHVEAGSSGDIPVSHEPTAAPT